jgi:Flp pilus assembly protein TadD
MMTNKNLKLFMLSVTGAAVLASCGGLGKMAKYAETITYDVNPSPLIVQGDSVEVTISGKFPGKYFHKKASVELTPTLVYEGGETAFEMSAFQGEKAAGNATVIPYANGKSFTFKDKVPYSADMEKSDLVIKILGKQGSKSKEFDPYKIADGVRTTPYLMLSDDKVVLGADKFQRTTSHNIDAIIYYLVNRWEVRTSELREQDMVELAKFVQDAAKDESISLKNLNIQSYASPEGEISLNENLAVNRAKSASTHVKGLLDRNKIKHDNSFFVERPKGEDWDGFKKLMQASDIKDKDLILRILEMYSDVTKREQEIRNLAATYVEVADKILPQLRRSQMSLAYDIVGKSDEEISNLAKSNPEALNVEELLYAATLTSDLNAKLKIYQDAERIFANDPRGANNVGYILMMQNKMNDAQAQFEKSNKIAKNDPATNNLGVIARLKGDRNRAEGLFKDALSGGNEVKYNLGLVQIQKGQYGDAVSNMGSFETFNLALVKMLNGDNDGALRAIETAPEKDTAEGYYLKAIIGARSKNADLMVTNLKSAVSKDPSLKDKAKKDLEFQKHWEDAPFKQVVN